MPEIKLKHVVSCSSEDSTHKAENLLSSDTYRKWKAAKAGEKQTSVILQFEKEEQVHGLDIGNEGSAFIEILVGHSTSVKDQDYEVLLVTSSFMSPSESRSGTNTNRVRLFGPNQLVKAAAQEKWDRVKIVCSQPYSKTIAYGIAFVKFHSPPDGSDPPAATPPKLTKLGQFRVKEDSPSSAPSLQPGSLFFNREGPSKPAVAHKVSPPSEKLSYAAAALQSAAAPSSAHGTAATPPTQAAVKRKFEFSKERLSAPAPPPSKKASPIGSPEPGNGAPKTKARPASESTSSPSSVKAAATPQRTPERKRESLPKSEPRAKPRPKGAEPAQASPPVPFGRILEGAVVVLSGFQNPFRAELRDKALALGARYRPDWSADSTHLICAFANTPKYSQVKAAGGAIVRKEWVLDCHKRKQRISYKRYLMDGAESSSEGSDAEDESEEEREKGKGRAPKEEKQATPTKHPAKREAGVKEEEEDEYGGSTDVDQAGNDDSGMDTEDELKRAESESRRRRGPVGVATGAGGASEDPYAGSTDENTDAEAEEDKPIPELPDFLTGKRFFLYGKFPPNERRLLLRYIIAFNGSVEDYMSEKVQFVITSEGWHDSFEDALMENGGLSFVKPSWIFSINQRQKMLPHQPYTVVP